MCGLGAARSEALPKSAVPLTAEEVTAIYSGHSSKWKNSNAWFAPDMSLKGIFGKKRDEVIFWGKWTVVENVVCMEAQYRNLKKGDTGNVSDCWTWFRDNKKRLWTLWSKRFDGSKVPKNDYYRTEIKNLVAGDIVSEKFDKLNSK